MATDPVLISAKGTWFLVATAHALHEPLMGCADERKGQRSINQRIFGALHRCSVVRDFLNVAPTHVGALYTRVELQHFVERGLRAFDTRRYDRRSDAIDPVQRQALAATKTEAEQHAVISFEVLGADPLLASPSPAFRGFDTDRHRIFSWTADAAFGDQCSMTETRTFTSYATPYDSFVGQRDISGLHKEDADRLIREIFCKDTDFRELVMEWNVRKKQAEGLWFLVVGLGLRLEEFGRIRDFQERDDDDIEKIISALDGTAVGRRVEEAFPPFDALSSRTTYDWSELEDLPNALDHYLSQPIRELIEDGDLAPAESDSVIRDRMSFEELHDPRNKGKWSLVVDRGMAYRVAPRVKTGLLGWASLICPVIFIASVPVMIWVNIWVGLAMIVAGIVILKWSAADLRKRIFEKALTDRDEYRWLMSRRVIWVRPRD